MQFKLTITGRLPKDVRVQTNIFDFPVNLYNDVKFLSDKAALEAHIDEQLELLRVNARQYLEVPMGMETLSPEEQKSTIGLLYK